MEFETNKTGRSHPLLLIGLSANVQKRAAKESYRFAKRTRTECKRMPKFPTAENPLPPQFCSQ